MPRECDWKKDGRCTLAEELVQIGPVPAYERFCDRCVANPSPDDPGEAFSQANRALRLAGKDTAPVHAARKAHRPTAEPLGPGVGREFAREAKRRWNWPTCGRCRQTAERMNALGPDGCRRSEAALVAEVLANAVALFEAHRSWVAWLARVVPQGIQALDVRDMLRAAIAAVEGQLATFPDESPETTEAQAAGVRLRMNPTVGRQTDDQGRPLVAAIVTCHNYDRFLAECLESLVNQSHPFAEILVVDDASDDATEFVAASYAEQGVRYLRVEVREMTLARRAGLAATTSPVVLFVDADDWLDPEYLAQQLPHLRNRNVGIVYGDYWREHADGTRDKPRFPPTANTTTLARTNVIPNTSLVRRAALEICDALQPAPPGVPEDWIRWRRIVQSGWQAVKGQGLHHYRQHSASWSSSTAADRTTYAAAWNLAAEPVTIAMPLSGRRHTWPRLRAWLESQTRAGCALLLIDTSGDAGFACDIRHWLTTAPYDDVQYVAVNVAPAGLADQDRRNRPDVQNAVELALCRIWDHVRRRVHTDWLLSVEDDNIPPADAITRLLAGVHDTRTAGVAACYRHRYGDQWCAWDHAGKLFAARGRGVVEVGGSGFGCCLLRTDVLRRHALWCDWGGHYDLAFWKAVRDAGDTILLDWETEAEHLVDRREAA